MVNLHFIFVLSFFVYFSTAKLPSPYIKVVTVLLCQVPIVTCVQVLVEGLPDWRMPAYYFRRMRKIGLAEGLAYLLGKLRRYILLNKQDVHPDSCSVGSGSMSFGSGSKLGRF